MCFLTVVLGNDTLIVLVEFGVIRLIANDLLIKRVWTIMHCISVVLLICN